MCQPGRTGSFHLRSRAMKKVVVWLTAVAGVGVIALSMSTSACSSGGSCTYVSKCGADIPFTSDQITTCNNRLNDPCCGGDYADYLGCYQSNQVCLDSGPNVGSTD